MLNTFALVGGVIDNPAPIGNGTYFRLRINVVNAKANRTDPVELIGKPADLDSIKAGQVVAVRGSIGGRINDKGYYNISLFCMDVTVIGGSQKQNEMPWENENVPY